MNENDLKFCLQEDALRLLNEAQSKTQEDAKRTETSVTRIMNAVSEQPDCQSSPSISPQNS